MRTRYPVLTDRVLNRTLLQRQHLLERVPLTVPEMVEHLVGLQAQAPLPPYVSLAARVECFDPHAVTLGLEDRSLVRLLTLRGTVHLHVADDALALRPWVQPRIDQERKGSPNTRPALHLDRAAFADAVSEVLADGPLADRALGAALAERFPDVAPHALTHLARVDLPLAQLPPRGTWGGSGGVVYQDVDRWVGRALVEPDPPAIVRRYLAAYGPATAADVSAWSGVRGIAPVLTAMDDLVVHEDEAGKRLLDLAGLEPVDEDVDAPVRLLGVYDNLWLSHAGRDRVTSPTARKRWMGANGGTASTVFVDGMMEGLWKVVDGRPTVVELFRDLTPRERAGLDEELDRVTTLLSTPPTRR